MESARKVGVEGAAEFLEDPNNGLKEVCLTNTKKWVDFT